MKHRLFSRYALEVLVYLATAQDRVFRVRQISQTLRIPHDNVRKIIADLSASGYVETKKGRGGGVVLKRDADTIQVGDIIRHVEGDGIAGDEWSTRTGGSGAQIGNLFAEAALAYFRVLDGNSVADLVAAARQSSTPAPIDETVSPRTS